MLVLTFRYNLLNREDAGPDSMKRVASTSAMSRMGPPHGIPARRSDSRDKPRGGFQSRGQMPPRPSKEREREGVLLAARQLSGGAATPGASRASAPPTLQVRGPGSRTQSRESSRNRGSGASTPVAEAAPVELSREKLETKTRAIIDEFLQIKDVKVRVGLSCFCKESCFE